MKLRIFLLVVFCALLVPRHVAAQGCQGVFTPEFSVYANYSLSSDASTLYSTVTIDGYTQINPSEYCPMTHAIHTPGVYNVLGSTGGWEYGPGESPTAYVDFSNSQQIPDQPGVVYYDYFEGQEDCSVAGIFYNSGSSSDFLKIGINNFKQYYNDANSCYYTNYCLSGTPSCPANDFTCTDCMPECESQTYAWVYDVVVDGECLNPGIYKLATSAHTCQ